jgi:ribosome modulation factor
MNENDVYGDGWRAHYEGVPRENNPHKIPKFRDAWDRGWVDASDDYQINIDPEDDLREF